MPRSNHTPLSSEPLQWEAHSGLGSIAADARFTVGRNGQGRWTVVDRDGHVGGTFVSEAAALSFARQEANHDLSQIYRSPDGVILEFSLH